MLLCREHHSSPVFTTKSKPFFAVAPFPGSWSLVARWSPFFGEDGLINITRGQAGALIKQREAFSLNLLSLETTFNDLYSSRFPLFAQHSCNSNYPCIVIILSSKMMLCFQIPFHRRRHFLPTSDSATTPCLFISVLFSSSCTSSVLKVKTQDQAIKFRVQSE